MTALNTLYRAGQAIFIGAQLDAHRKSLQRLRLIVRRTRMPGSLMEWHVLHGSPRRLISTRGDADALIPSEVRMPVGRQCRVNRLVDPWFAERVGRQVWMPCTTMSSWQDAAGLVASRSSAKASRLAPHPAALRVDAHAIATYQDRFSGEVGGRQVRRPARCLLDLQDRTTRNEASMRLNRIFCDGPAATHRHRSAPAGVGHVARGSCVCARRAARHLDCAARSSGPKSSRPRASKSRSPGGDPAAAGDGRVAAQDYPGPGEVPQRAHGTDRCKGHRAGEALVFPCSPPCSVVRPG